MAIQTTTVTTTAATKIGTARKPHNLDYYFATIGVSGTFGGACTFTMSFDNGVTLLPLKDQSGTQWAPTTTDAMDVMLGAGGKNSDQITLWATSATTPTLTITVADNL